MLLKVGIKLFMVVVVRIRQFLMTCSDLNSCPIPIFLLSFLPFIFQPVVQSSVQVLRGFSEGGHRVLEKAFKAQQC